MGGLKWRMDGDILSSENKAAAGGGVSRRAVVLGLVLLVLIAPAAFYGEFLYGTTYEFGSGVPAMAPLVVLFLLAVVNPLLGRVLGGGLGRRELLAIYGIVLVGAPLVTHGILGWMLPMGINQYYLARAIPEWETAFLQYVPVWFAPSDVATAENFFQGRASVPWGEWWTPLAAWGSFMTALFLSTLFLMVLFQRQWITHERLSFPLAQVPLEMVREGGKRDGGRGRVAAGWVFWIGFLISFGLTSLSRLSGMFPAIPDVPLSGVTLMQWQRTGPLAGLGAFELWLVPWMIALAYLIPKELSFSCWFFWVLRIGLTVAAIAAGATPQRPEEWWGSTFPAPTYQGGGALLALSVWAVWVGRRHLGRAIRLAFSRGGEGEEAKEPLTYRWALIGFLLTFGYMVYFCWAAGSRVTVGAAIVGLIIINYFMWARLRGETGLGFIPFPLSVNSMIVVPFGSTIFRPQEVVTLLYARWTYFPGFGESFEVCTGNALESFKIADSARISSRALTYAIMGGFVVSLAIGMFVVMTGMYEYGFFNTRGGAASGWLRGQLRGIGTSVFTMLTTPTKSDVNGTIAMGAGAVVAILLGTLRLRFWWWPFHPVGYLAANAWGMHWFSQPFFLGWALKSVAIRYGGLRLFRRTVPLAIGLIVGDFVSQGLWVALLTPLRAAGVNV
ncbi:MAG: hypothetical protein JSV79_13475 [Armatimonadota bacterium]|nr:MAG: hypothetical protein JSV79_13475 [Armatimonadota bacterium]